MWELKKSVEERISRNDPASRLLRPGGGFVHGYTAELAVSAIISSWCRGEAEQNRQPVLVQKLFLGTKSNSPTGMEFAIRYTGWISSLQATHSAVPANTRIETLALTRVMDNLYKFKREWGRNGKQPLGDV